MKDFCVRGHSIKEFGRYRNAQCRKCASDDSKAKRKAQVNGVKKYCRNGHNNSVGRYSNGACRSCVQLHNARKRQKAHPGKRAVPTKRLRSITTREQAAAAYQQRNRCSRETAQKASQRLFNNDWILIDTADEWCIALDTHLSIVFPELYIGKDDIEETG